MMLNMIDGWASRSFLFSVNKTHYELFISFVPFIAHHCRASCRLEDAFWLGIDRMLNQSLLEKGAVICGVYDFKSKIAQ